MTKKRDRFFALFGAILFFVTASALTIAIIVNGINNRKNNDKSKTDTAQTSTTADAAKTTDTKDQATTPPAATNKLEGTMLQDFTPIAKIDKLETQDTKPGDGDVVKPGDTVTVDYTGALASNGTIFQSSLDTGNTISFSLNEVITGWQQGIPGMKVGGTRRLLIPAALAYGSIAKPGIPANSDLVFDVTLHKIGK